MKLFLVVAISLILCIQFSQQLPLGTKDRKPYLSIRDHNPLKLFVFQNKHFGKIWKNHGIRNVQGEEEDDAETNARADSNTVGEEKTLTKRGWFKNPFKDIYKELEEKVKEHIPVKRDVKGDTPATDTKEALVIPETSEFDLGKGVNIDGGNVDLHLKPDAEEAEIQKVKRGWFKKLWNTIKNVVVGSIIGMIKRDTNGEFIELDDDSDKLIVALSDDIVEVNLGTTHSQNKAQNEKEIEIVKRGFFKKIGRKIKNVVTGAVAGSLVGSMIKRATKDKEENAKASLPLLLKTLRLRPGTADEITKIVEKLGNDSVFQDTVTDEIFNGNDKDGDTVVEINGKSIRCRFVRGKFICF